MVMTVLNKSQTPQVNVTRLPFREMTDRQVIVMSIITATLVLTFVEQSRDFDIGEF